MADMNSNYYWIIKVLDRQGNFYTNALIENDHDAMQVALFYRNQLGYTVQLWHAEKDMTALLDSVKIVSVPKGVS